MVGDKGSVYFNGRPEIVQMYSGEGADFPDTIVCPKVYGKPRGFAYDSIKAFADCVCSDREPSTGYEDGLVATKVILAMEESVAKGEPVVVK